MCFTFLHLQCSRFVYTSITANTGITCVNMATKSLGDISAPSSSYETTVVHAVSHLPKCCFVTVTVYTYRLCASGVGFGSLAKGLQGEAQGAEQSEQRGGGLSALTVGGTLVIDGNKLPGRLR